MGRPFWTLIFAMLVNHLGTMVGPFLPLWLARERGEEEAAIAALLSIANASAAGGSPAGGWLADAIGRRWSLILGLVVNASSMLAIPLVPDEGTLIAAMVVRSFTNDLLRPPMNAAVADMTPLHLHGKAFGIVRATGNLGFCIGTFAGGLLIKHGAFDVVFVVDAVTGFAAAVLIALFVSETRPSSAPGRDAVASRAATGLVTEARFSAFCLVSLAVRAISIQLVTSLPIALHHLGGKLEESYGELLALNGLLVTIIQVPISGAIARVRPAVALALGALLYGLGFGAVGCSTTKTALAASIGLITCGEVLFYPLSAAWTAGVAPPADRGRWFGRLNGAYGVGAVLSPIAGAWIMGRWDDPTLFRLSAPVGAVAALALLVVARTSAMSAPSANLDPPASPGENIAGAENDPESQVEPAAQG
jgi:MFS family permease